jgi:hypothetical protein
MDSDPFTAFRLDPDPFTALHLGTDPISGSKFPTSNYTRLLKRRNVAETDPGAGGSVILLPSGVGAELQIIAPDPDPTFFYQRLETVQNKI